MPVLILDIKINTIKIRSMSFLSKSSVGTVEPYSSLECEVTWQPGFSSPERGEFILHVNEGNTMILKCVAQVMISFGYDFYFEDSKSVGHIYVCIVVYIYYVSKTDFACNIYLTELPILLVPLLYHK